jgi:hypothetical protein
MEIAKKNLDCPRDIIVIHMIEHDCLRLLHQVYPQTQDQEGGIAVIRSRRNDVAGSFRHADSANEEKVTRHIERCEEQGSVGTVVILLAWK